MIVYAILGTVAVIVLTSFNSFHSIPFIDVLLIRNGNIIENIVFRKPTISDIYLNWNYFAPNISKRISSLRTLMKQGYLICSSEYHLVDQLEQYKYLFEKYSNLPSWVMNVF